MAELMMPDWGGAYARGQLIHQQRQEAEQQNALRAFMQENGGALMAGDQNALAAYAAFDPQGAFTMQRQRQADAMDRERMDLTRRSTEAGMANDAERLKMARAEGQRQAQAFAAQLDDRQRADVAAKAKQTSETALVAYKQGPEAWDKWNDSNPEFENISYEDAPIKISTALGALDALMPQGAEETAEMRNLRFRATQAGLQEGTPEYQSFMANGGVPRGMSLSVGPDGTVDFKDGAIGSAGLIPKAPSGFANVQGPDGITQAPIAGGPGTQISGEIAGRIGIAEDSLKQLPDLIEQARSGNLTGVRNWLTGRIGRGEQGEARRENMAGSEAIVRMLTGAGMNLAEAQREVEMYIIAPWDDAQAATNKLEQLQRRLTELHGVATQGRGNAVAIDPSTGMGVAPQRMRFNPETGEIE